VKKKRNYWKNSIWNSMVTLIFIIHSWKNQLLKRIK